MMGDEFPGWHGTTIIGVKKGGEIVIAGDGQVSLGQTVIKGTARKVRRLSPGGYDVVAGFAGSTADAMALIHRFEARLEGYRGNLQRAAVELAKDWRLDRSLRRLEALLVAACWLHGRSIRAAFPIRCLRGPTKTYLALG